MSDIVLSQMTKMAEQLTPEEKQELIKRLTSGALNPPAVSPRDLYGIWRNQVPEDVDIDCMLDEVRNEWKKEWPETIDR